MDFPKPITDDPLGRYVTVEAPDHVLIELFEVDLDTIPAEQRPFFA